MLQWKMWKLLPLSAFIWLDAFGTFCNVCLGLSMLLLLFLLFLVCVRKHISRIIYHALCGKCYCSLFLGSRMWNSMISIRFVFDSIRFVSGSIYVQSIGQWFIKHFVIMLHVACCLHIAAAIAVDMAVAITHCLCPLKSPATAHSTSTIISKRACECK